jgi:hypothetical protein
LQQRRTAPLNTNSGAMASAAGLDSGTIASVKKIPLLTTKAGPRDGEEWVKRLKEEYKVPQLLAYFAENSYHFLREF